MVTVKKTELALARDLYAQAYEPVRRKQTLEALESTAISASRRREFTRARKSSRSLIASVDAPERETCRVC
jgi:hypothetical protein